MLLHDRSVAINIAVLCFFALSIIGWMTGHSLFICCKRALIGAIITYVIGGWAVKAINAILIRAMIESQMSQKERSPFTVNRNVECKDRRRGSTDG